jgi:hypothetical protein
VCQTLQAAMKPGVDLRWRSSTRSGQALDYGAVHSIQRIGWQRRQQIGTPRRGALDSAVAAPTGDRGVVT